MPIMSADGGFVPGVENNVSGSALEKLFVFGRFKQQSVIGLPFS